MIKILLPVLVVIMVWVTSLPAGALEFLLEGHGPFFCFSILVIVVILLAWFGNLKLQIGRAHV